ncbi:chemotaxis protein CheC [Candidatus Bathyarchaeota archaeon]|nr:chemotaxis protein CheC [Candidatus Bathyarchaeota archaeon]
MTDINSDIIHATVVDEYFDLDVLRELGSIGAGNAATSLSEILQQHVSIDVPKVYALPPHLVPKFYEMHDKPTTAIYMQLNGEYDCDILLLFDFEEERKMAALMTMASSPDEVDPELSVSAIAELGNILIGSFLSAIADFAGVTLVPTHPQRVVDSFDAILDNFLVKQALLSNLSLIFETRFKKGDGSVGCILMMFPSKELSQILVEKVKEFI